MTDLEALEATIARTGVERYRHLCSSANERPPPNDPATWRAYMHTLAGGEAPSRAPTIAVDYGQGDAPPCGSCP